ncbi:MAG: hypothetical protein PF568_03450, partial [Deltaproteobacteria bacterium]|nr:hypothetical protein [Deltaproteobacteria bacterium]
MPNFIFTTFVLIKRYHHVMWRACMGVLWSCGAAAYLWRVMEKCFCCFRCLRAALYIKILFLYCEKFSGGWAMTEIGKTKPQGQPPRAVQEKEGKALDARKSRGQGSGQAVAEDVKLT